MLTESDYRKVWQTKTVKQLEKEIISWRKYMDKHGAAYCWHGKDITPPGHLADGDKVSVLKEILSGKQLNEASI